MNERRKNVPRDPGAYIGSRPERSTESLERNQATRPGGRRGRPGMTFEHRSTPSGSGSTLTGATTPPQEVTVDERAVYPVQPRDPAQPVASPEIDEGTTTPAPGDTGSEGAGS